MEHNVYVQLRDLPSFSRLNEKVREVELNSTWWEKYGLQWLHITGGVVTAAVGLLLLRDGGIFNTAIGFVLLGVFNVILTQNAGHLASHNALAESKSWNKFWCITFIEFLGSFSEDAGRDIHIREHHPHTNIIGRGDSSAWKIPGLPGMVYLFAAPIFLPPLSPFISIGLLVRERSYSAIPRFVLVAAAGIALRIWLFMEVCGYSLLQSVVAFWAYQAVFMLPYIHINIFQHIGLPMYSEKNRPARIYQMSTGVLNLNRNPILDLTFGHSLINCHVEHHLFPRLSDNMCLKIKPLVKQYLLEHGLPYNEKPYMERLGVFMNSYDQLMEKAPPITHFIGLQ